LIRELLAAEIIDYKTLPIYADNQGHQIFKFWKFHERRLPVLSTIAKRILVIQASSSESEGHFSAGGMIVNERRGRLSENSVESLIVLREAYLNEMWPKCNTSDSPEDHSNQQLQESISMTSIADPEVCLCRNICFCII
jgi:hypothetical protein